MKYMGSKRSISKYILPYILEHDTKDTWYIEPFVGGCNSIDKIYKEKRWGNDNNYYLISLYHAFQNNWIPIKELSENEYKDIQQNKEKYPPELVAYVGFACSYGGKWFGGYPRGTTDKGIPRNHILEAYHNVKNQIPLLQNIKFTCMEYDQLKIPSGSIVYCDPPYEGSTEYKTSFDHDKFWNWCRINSTNNHLYISEYSAPDDFKCIWKANVASGLAKKDRTEKLFVYKENL